MRELIELATKMRASQKACFSTRHPKHLEASKVYERAFDEMLEEHNNPKLGL